MKSLYLGAINYNLIMSLPFLEIQDIDLMFFDQLPFKCYLDRNVTMEKCRNISAIDKLKEITKLLIKAGIEDASKEAEDMVCSALNTNRTVLYRDNPDINKTIASKIDSYIKRRLKHEPLQYILGEVYFFGLRLKIGIGVLIPRPETELLVEEAIKKISDFRFQISDLKIIDLCCGSGCIALALAKSFPEVEVYATDISDDALRYARDNAHINNIENVFLQKGHLFEPVKVERFHLIISNPPYIKSGDIENLQPEIKLYEPRDAIDGGEDGLDCYREILSQAKDYLYPKGLIMFEIDENQGVILKELAKSYGFKKIKIKKDYSKKNRIALIQ